MQEVFDRFLSPMLSHTFILLKMFSDIFIIIGQARRARPAKRIVRISYLFLNTIVSGRYI